MWVRGGDAGEDLYVTFETLRKPFSQVSESQECWSEIWRRKKQDKQIKSTASKKKRQKNTESDRGEVVQKLQQV